MIMTANYAGPGKRIPYSNSGSAINPGDVVVRVSGSSGVVGIATDSIAATTGTGVLDIDGEWTFPKVTGHAFTDGMVLYWDATNKWVTTVSTGNTRIGRSVGAYASAATTANVSINKF